MALENLQQGWGAPVRIIVIAAAGCLCLVGLADADNANAAIRKPVNIPAEDLGPALQALATDYDFQVLYRTEIVKDLHTRGAVGSLTSDEALGKLLGGTGLTYKYLDDKTVTIVPSASGAGATVDPTNQPAPARDATTGGGKKTSPDFRLAQVDQGASSRTSSAAGVDNSSARGGAAAQTSSGAQIVRLEEIVVTAQKRQENLLDTPMSVFGADRRRSRAQSRHPFRGLRRRGPRPESDPRRTGG